MTTGRMWAALSRRWARSALSSDRAEVAISIRRRPTGSAWIHTYQIRKPPSTAPQLLPEPPTITITQIRNVKRIGW